MGGAKKIKNVITICIDQTNISESLNYASVPQKKVNIKGTQLQNISKYVRTWSNVKHMITNWSA